MNKKGQGRLILAVLIIACVGQINTIASVMMADIAAEFPDASATAIQYVMQFGMIGGFPVSLAMTVLSQKFRKKPMILIGMACILIGGAIPIVSHSSLAVLYVCAFLVGAGQGFITPLLGTIILLNFEGSMKDRMIGLNTTFGTGGAALLLVIAGWVCKTGWVNVYYIYFAVVPVFLIALVCLPMDEKPQPIAATESGSKAAIPAKGAIQCLLAVCMMIGYVTFPLNLAMFVVGEGIGDPASVGLGMSLVTVVGALVGLILPQIIKMFKLYISALGAAFGFLSTVCVIVAGNMMMVYVVEKSDALGGMLKFADKDEHKYDLANYLHYLRRQVGKRAINVRLNTEATVELIEREKPYAVICGVGAQPVTPRFPGMDRLPCMHALEAYEHPETVKSEDVVVIGGGLVGCEVAVFLGARGKKVSLVEMQDTLAPEANRIHKDSMMEALTDPANSITQYVSTKCLELTPDGVRVQTPDGEEKVLPAGTVVYAVGMRARQDLAMELQSAGGVKRFFTIGDCQTPQRIKNAVHDGYYAAMDII